MIRRVLLLLAGLLLLLAGTECAPKQPEAKKKRFHHLWWEIEQIPTTEDDYHVSRLPPLTTIPHWYVTSQQPQKNCNIHAGRVVASSGGIGIGTPDGRYNNNEHCVWEIQVPEGLTMKFTWEYFDLEGPSPSCPYDFVDISEYATGKTLTGRVCGSEVPRSVTSRSNLVAVTFKSDDSVTLQGFWLQFEAISVTTASDHYKTTPQVGTTTTEWYDRTQLPQMNCTVEAGRVVGSTGEIATGAYNGTYNNNEHCVWEIQVPEGMVINFTWEAFDLEGQMPGCPYDYVDISDYATGESLTGRLCGSNIPGPVKSRTNFVVVTFETDASVTLKGFTLKFAAIPVTTTPAHYETTVPTETTTMHWHETTQLPQMNCSVDAGRVRKSAGEITIGARDGTYNNNEYCVWEIQVPEGLVINFTWEAFDLEGHTPGCPYDYVDISEYAMGDSLTGRLCGSNIPPPVISRTNFVVVTFKTDTSVTLKGFTLKFEAIPVVVNDN